MNLKQWDELVAPRLHALANAGQWIKHYASEARSAVEALPERPDFTSEAVIALREAEIALAGSLEVLQAARRAYGDKPVERSGPNEPAPSMVSAET